MLAPANRGCQQHFRTWDAWRLVECHGENGDGGEGAEPGAGENDHRRRRVQRHRTREHPRDSGVVLSMQRPRAHLPSPPQPTPAAWISACRWLGLAITCALTVGMATCAAPPQAPGAVSARGQGDPLWVPEGARVTAPATRDDQVASAVVFTMTTEDLEGLSTAIAGHMADDGWHEHVEGEAWRGTPRSTPVWRRVGGVIQRDAKGEPIYADVRSWGCQWLNMRGDVMQYKLDAHREQLTGPYEVIGQGLHVPGQ